MFPLSVYKMSANLLDLWKISTCLKENYNEKVKKYEESFNQILNQLQHGKRISLG